MDDPELETALATAFMRLADQSDRKDLSPEILARVERADRRRVSVLAAAALAGGVITIAGFASSAAGSSAATLLREALQFGGVGLTSGQPHSWALMVASLALTVLVAARSVVRDF